ncbi:MAG TPA: hypothetical protein VKX49_12080 [Bryobacteraceae bacterium]|nr:hypothetical protein [Bryobacteraceae bacterium]
MRYFLSKRLPPFTRVLLIESGNRELYEELLKGLYDLHPGVRADLLTCFAGTPKNFRPDSGRIYRVTDYPGRANRKHLYQDLAANRYAVAGIICCAQPIMTKWKWVLAARLPAKIFILNENGDYFWIDRGHLGTIRHFVLFRAGLTGAGAIRTIARLLSFPFTLLYLILYAMTVHLRRKLRTL